METKTEYQRQLAESLIQSVGVEEAVYFALQNQWMGGRTENAGPRGPVPLTGDRTVEEKGT